MVVDERAGSIRVNRIAIVLLIMSSTTLGIAPVILFIGRPQLLIYVAICALIVAVFKIRLFETSATEVPGLLEFIFGGLGAIFPAALTGIIWLITYGLILGGVTLFVFIATLLSYEMHLNAELIAYYLSLLSAIVGGYVYVSEGVDTLARQLYPQTAGVKSAFYDARARTVYTLLVFSGSVLAVALVTGIFTTWWFNVGLLIILVFVSVGFSQKGETIYATKSENAIKAVSKLFSACGYQVFSSPRTGKSEIDPLLVGLDLFAQRKERAFAIEVHTPESELKESVMPTDETLMAALALGSFFQETPNGVLDRVAPMIVFIGKEANDKIKAFSKKEAVQIIEISDLEVVNQILETESQEELRKMASRYLGISYNDEALSASQNDLEVPRGEAQ